MGLYFTAGTEFDVFNPQFASKVQKQLGRQFDYKIAVNSCPIDAYYSEEVAWSGWEDLQIWVSAVVGKNTVPQLLAVDAWRGVYLPFALKPTSIEIEASEVLKCASLPLLIAEMQLFADKQSLPIENSGLTKLWKRLSRKNAQTEADSKIEVYIQLMLSASIADEKKMPLWVVK